MRIGSEQQHNPALDTPEGLYIRIFGYPAQGLHVRAKAVIPLIRRLGSPVSILDAGCGRGAFTFAAARCHPTAAVVGVDSDEALIAQNRSIAKRCGLHNVSFVCRDLRAIADMGPFDAIISTDCLEHVEDDDALLQTLARVLTPSGSVILHVPHRTRNLFGWSRPNFMGIEGHVRPGYVMPELVGKVRGAGLEVVSSGYNYNSWETLANDISYLITGGRERRKHLYALAFPFLLLMTRLFPWTPGKPGSAITLLAEKTS